MTVGMSKTKLLVAGLHVESDSDTPIQIRGDAIEMVSVFKYLDAMVDESQEGCGRENCSSFKGLWCSKKTCVPR